MGKIHILSEDLKNKIAAGEVVERPASVVKELIENSIDAGAKNIDVLVSGGGNASVQVVDDGGGLESDDLKLAFSRHTTSKIESPDDLHRINTLGFRGEALASIASVSKVRAISTVNGGAGSEIAVKNGRNIRTGSGFYGRRDVNLSDRPILLSARAQKVSEKCQSGAEARYSGRQEICSQLS